VETSAAGEDKEELSEAEVLLEGLLEHFHGDHEQSPALAANALTLAAGSHVIVVIHIEVEDQLPFQGLGIGRVLLGSTGPDSSSVKLKWCASIWVDHALLHFLGSGKDNIPFDILLIVLLIERFEGQLAVGEGRLAVVCEPIGKGLEGKEVVVVGAKIFERHWREKYNNPPSYSIHQGRDYWANNHHSLLFCIHSVTL
jgi:hypothetical protein